MNLADAKPIDENTPSPFTGWMITPKGNTRYRNVIITSALAGHVHRYTDPDGIHRYFTKGTLTHWSSA